MRDASVVEPPRNKPSIEKFSQAPLPTSRGQFQVVVFKEAGSSGTMEHVAMMMGNVAGGEGVPVRIHSECLTSEVLGSLKCDCRAQLDRALDFIAEAGRGVLVYLRQEGRGIGLGNKIRAYALQAQGHDTYDANRLLGFADDLRRYDNAAEILRQLGIKSVELITNNPLKISGLMDAGIPVLRRIELGTPVTPHNVEYLRAKRDRTGHLLTMSGDDQDPPAKLACPV